MTELLCPAAWGGMVEEVVELLPQITPFGVNKLNKKGNNRSELSKQIGQTALYCAARQGHILILIELLNFVGIEIDKFTADHETPLHGMNSWRVIRFMILAAGFQGHEEATALLLFRGANSSLVNVKGVSARCAATGHAINAFSTLDSEGREGLLRKYPSLAKLTNMKDPVPGKHLTMGLFVPFDLKLILVR